MREYVEGESLRKVHWPSTAHRGQLMVKELEDAPRDEVAVLLDGDARAGDAGELRHRGARRRLDPAGAACGAGAGARSSSTRQRATSSLSPPTATGGARWSYSQPPDADAPTPAFAMLQADGGVAARSLELVVVTSRARRAARRPARPAGALTRRGVVARLRRGGAGPGSRSSCAYRLPASRWPSSAAGDDLAHRARRPRGARCVGHSPSRSCPPR